MLPNFFVIGAAKSGTTSLHVWLGLHPEIHMSPVKEPHYFVDHERVVALRIPVVGRRGDYEALFDSDRPLRGESSPSYSMHPWLPDVAARIRRTVPDARFIYVVRDPVDRTVAHFLQRAAATGDRRPFAEMLRGIDDPDHELGAASRYATQVEKYLEHFDGDRMLVVDSADLLHDRRRALKDVFAFLGADEQFWSPAFEIEHNRTSEKRQLVGAFAAARDSTLGRAVRRLPPSVRDPLVSGARQLVTRPLERPALDLDAQRRMRDAFQDEVDRLRALTGKQFTTWSL